MTERTQTAASPVAGHRRAGLSAPGAFGAAVAVALLGSVLAHPAHGPGMTSPVVGIADLRGTDAEPRQARETVPFADALDPLRVTLGSKLSHWAWAQRDPSPPRETVAEAPQPPAPVDAAPPRTAMTVPLPVPRPAELRGGGVRRAGRAPAQQQAAAVAPPPEDTRSFFEKLFGVESPPARSYVALESKPADLIPAPRLSPPVAPPPGPGGTATYDITARIVILPNGERLEAHSGLGEIMDDPSHVDVRMRGATPPGTYVLTEREQLFHGVRAIRLTPVGGPDAVYGRVGLLAHTFMLGPTGASNGCVSFRDYNRFLESYLRGEIRQLVVVSGSGSAPPTLAGRAIRVAGN